MQVTGGSWPPPQSLAKPVLDQAPPERIPGHQWLSQHMTSGARNAHAARPPSVSHYPRSAAGNLICVSAPSARLGEIDLGSLETSAAGRKVRHICAHVACGLVGSHITMPTVGLGTVQRGPCQGRQWTPRAWSPPDASSSEAGAAQPESLQDLWAKAPYNVMPSCLRVSGCAQRVENSPAQTRTAERGPGLGSTSTLATSITPLLPQPSSSLRMPSALTLQLISTVKVHLWNTPHKFVLSSSSCIPNKQGETRLI